MGKRYVVESGESPSHTKSKVSERGEARTPRLPKRAKPKAKRVPPEASEGERLPTPGEQSGR